MIEDICLVIKAANQKYDDVKVDCQLSWSILDLKNYLSINYPSKPKITDQRIIYSDRLQNTFIFHLVCPQKHLTKNNNDTANTINVTTNGSSSLPSSSSNNLDAFPNITGSSQSSSTPMPTPTAAAAAWNQFNQMNIQMGPDNMLMQQSYQILMNQYYQYMSYYFLSSPPIDFVSYAAFTNAYMQSIQPVNDNQQQQQQQSNSIGTTLNNIRSNSVPATDNNNNNLNNNRINNRQQQQQPQAALGGVGVAAAAVVIDNDDLMNRDWTDWMYSFSKAIIMLSIIYFYSSLNRLVLFMLIFLIIYFYKNLLNGIHQANGGGGRGNNNNNNDIRINNDRNNPINQNNNNNNERINQANIHADSLENNHHQQQQQQDDDGNNNSQYYSGLRFVWMFITSLFTSLIPDPVPIN
ncbi:response to unfolded protein [Dermatophagoides pteronyssinus]|uniref:Response to unfolded protein n=1 Tax=Dermatophagoides pteronyssinus TaxID=6956 RepID=A0ABQ8JAM1_DERPT|nr:response to unfolded protein [Dermatophagoides pteronyssinus]